MAGDGEDERSTREFKSIDGMRVSVAKHTCTKDPYILKTLYTWPDWYIMHRCTRQIVNTQVDVRGLQIRHAWRWIPTHQRIMARTVNNAVGLL